MATKPPDLIAAGSGFQKVVWRDLKADDEGQPFDALANSASSGYTNFLVQVEGVFAGAEVSIVGSIIPETFTVLENFSFSDFKRVLAPDMVKPMVIGGNKDTKITVGLLVTR